MDNKKDISVIIPCYDRFSKLKRLLLTIPDLSNIEIIVVNDKSQDIIEYQNLKKYMSFRSNVVFIDNNTDKKGAGVSRNIGLDHAHGKWVLFADSDDYFSGNAFDTIGRFVDSGADIIYFSPSSIDETSGFLSDRHIDSCNLIKNVIKKHSELSEDMIRFFWSTPWSKLIRRSLIEENDIRFDNVIVSNDVMFSMKTGVAAKTIDVCSEVIYIVTKSKGTLTSTRSRANFLKRVDVNIHRYIYLKEKLEKKRFQKLGICGANWILAAFYDGYGIRMILKIMRKYIVNHVPLFSIYLVRNYLMMYFLKNVE